MANTKLEMIKELAEKKPEPVKEKPKRAPKKK
jgi:hypothetical protein